MVDSPLKGRRGRLGLAGLALIAGGAAAQSVPDPVDLANVFVGSDKGGNTVPGAAVPFGLVALSPDTTRGETNGYDPRSPVTGFSFTHESGTGGHSKYGNFRVLPTIGRLDPRGAALRRIQELGRPGYYRASLDAGAAGPILVEASATRRVGILRLTYPRGGDANLMLDVTSSIQLMGEGPIATAAHVEWSDAQTFSGWGNFTGGWNVAPVKLYFAAAFDRPASSHGNWQADRGSLQLLPPASADGGDQRTDPFRRLGAYARFDSAPDNVVQLKLAVSFVSMEQARRTLATELPGWDFTAARNAAEAQWRDALSRITVEGGSDAERRNFYSALYRSHAMPHDVSGENVWWSSPEPHYEDFYTIWDTFRTLHPLLTLIQPDRQRAMIRSLLDTYRHTGWLPDSRIAGANGMTQGGSNGDVLIADAIVKKLGGFDATLALEAIRKDGEVASADPLNVGRALEGYVALGYMPLDLNRSASRTLEYSYDDFAIAEVAQALGHGDVARNYLKRSTSWRNLWDADLRCIRPRYGNGDWLADFDCAHVYPDNRSAWWDAPFYEGSSLQYSTYVPHDVAGLIALTGGISAFVGWLDQLFDGGGYDHSNEPDFLAPYLYIHAGRPDRTAERVRTILARNYRPTHDGLPGNDDAGAMSSWYVWSSIGLFPNAGQPFYYIGSPVFTRSTIRLEGGRSFTIVAPAASPERPYVVAARLNGRPIDRAWLTHDEIARGGRLDLDMAEAPAGWATHFQAPPNPFLPPPSAHNDAR